MGSVMIDKELLGQIILTLKNLNVQGYDSMDMLVGCVGALTQAYNAPAKNEEGGGADG